MIEKIDLTKFKKYIEEHPTDDTSKLDKLNQMKQKEIERAKYEVEQINNLRKWGDKKIDEQMEKLK